METGLSMVSPLVSVTLLFSHSTLGMEYTDTVTLAPSLVISEQSIGVALNVTNISGVDGILG
jgi:hypothetical protein